MRGSKVNIAVKWSVTPFSEGKMVMNEQKNDW